MSTTSLPPPRLGRCPDCLTEIASYDVRIAEPAGADPMVLATCPRCGTRVNPE